MAAKKQPESIFDVVRPGSGDAARLTIERELARRAARFTAAYGHRYYYAGVGDFVAEHGRLYQGVTWPIPDRYKKHVGRPNWCYRNAYEAARDNPELRYCEGLYMVGISSAGHAWCLDPDDSVIELTIPIEVIEQMGGVEQTRINTAGKHMDDPRLWTYYGVEIPLDTVRLNYERLGCDNSGSSIPVLDDAFADDNEGSEIWGVEDPAPIFKRPWRP